MNFNTNIDNFKLDDFKLDIKKIEKTETNVWEFHNTNNIVELFNSIKNRRFFIEDLLQIYIKSNEKYSRILNEISQKYPEIKSINFYNKYEQIIDIFSNLNLVSISQFDKLNISENLIEVKKREKILNSNKIIENESEFTTLIKQLLNLVNDTKDIEKNENFENNNLEINNGEKLSNLNQNENLKEIKDEIIEVLEKEEELINKSRFEEENIDKKILETIQNDEDKKILNEKSFNLNQEKVDVEIEVPIIGVEENKNDIKLEEKSFIIEKKKESTNEEIENIIEKYFSYQDSYELDEVEKENILKQSLNSNSAIKYAKILLKLKKENLLDEVEFLAKQIFAKTLTNLSYYGIEPTPYSMSQSWAIWDLAKQFYYLNNPNESNEKYNIVNPIESLDKQQEIIDRHIGWVVHSQMTTGKLDNFLSKIQGSIYGKRIVEYMIAKPNKNETLPSYKLADLGKNVRLGFEK